MKKFAPGCYYDEEKDEVHILADEILLAHGYLPTPENLKVVRDVARDVCAEEFPDAKIHERGFDS